MLPNNQKVNFLICGAQKSGTTALNKFLNAHPQICMADTKELHFFDNEESFSKDPPDYSSYHKRFSPEPSHLLFGEATPIYIYWEPAAKRIFDYNPQMKLIVLLRNPIERAYSQWNMNREKKWESRSFLDAILNEEESCSDSLPLQHRKFSYQDRGFYLNQLQRFWSFFPKEQILVMKTEYLWKSPENALEEVFSFLEVTPSINIETRAVHSRDYEKEMSEKERQYLRTVFEPEIKRLEDVLGWDCSSWLS